MESGSIRSSLVIEDTLHAKQLLRIDSITVVFPHLAKRIIASALLSTITDNDNTNRISHLTPPFVLPMMIASNGDPNKHPI